MAIKDVSGWPDDRVPAWVREARERDREARRIERLKLCSCNLHFGLRREVLEHCRDTGHAPLVTGLEDKYLKLREKKP